MFFEQSPQSRPQLPRAQGHEHESLRKNDQEKQTLFIWLSPFYEKCIVSDLSIRTTPPRPFCLLTSVPLPFLPSGPLRLLSDGHPKDGLQDPPQAMGQEDGTLLKASDAPAWDSKTEDTRFLRVTGGSIVLERRSHQEGQAFWCLEHII